MTKRLFDTDSYVFEGDFCVTDCLEVEDGFEVVLESTCFFPEEGGQTCDRGVLDGQEVKHVRIKDDVIYHLVSQRIEPGRTVHGRIDAGHRFSNMQQHSGEHIMSGLIHERFGCDNVGFHLSDNIVTLDFNGVFTDEELAELETAANRVITENRKVSVSFYPDEEAKKLTYRSKKDIKGIIRLVTIEGVDVCACCAPHVSLTGEVGLLKIVSAEHFRGGTRMSILCGFRALEYIRQKQKSVQDISVLLKVKPEEVSDAVVKVKDDLDRLRFSFNHLQNRLMSLKTDIIIKTGLGEFEDAALGVYAGMEYVLLFDEDADAASAREAVNTLTARTEKTVIVFFGNDETGWGYIAGSSKDLANETAKLMRENFSGKGGGSPKMVQGHVDAKRTELVDFFAKKKDQSYRVILASGSPRRREILGRIGVAFEIIKSDKEEDMTGTDPREMVRRLSAMKAEDVFERVSPGEKTIVIGADTVVALENEILGKPKDRADAKKMLKDLSGRSHEVHTGLCLIIKDGGTKKLSFDVTTKVYVDELTDSEIDDYIETKEPLDKAGAYAIQGIFSKYVEKIEGSYLNVVGFPIEQIIKAIKVEGIDLGK
ncbi:MAG: septum formation protein Maf [Lachnospiraceae bacterium]|nr:septum formation protein Maf [Lachnospiraceae bacterium]